jgi:hypothetical protein
MLTLRTSAHIPSNRHCRNFRIIPNSTGRPRARAEVRHLLQEWTRLWNAELRCAWLGDGWSAHAGRVQSKPSRRHS